MTAVKQAWLSYRAERWQHQPALAGRDDGAHTAALRAAHLCSTYPVRLSSACNRQSWQLSHTHLISALKRRSLPPVSWRVKLQDTCQQVHQIAWHNLCRAGRESGKGHKSTPLRAWTSGMQAYNILREGTPTGRDEPAAHVLQVRSS